MQRTTPIITAGTAVGTVFGLLSLGGCADYNARNRLGNSVDLRVLAGAAAGAGEPMAIDDGVRTVTADRLEWPAEVFFVPVDGTVYGPTRSVRASRLRFVDSDEESRRRAGLFPTAESAASVEEGPGWTVAAEGAAGPVMAVVDVALLVPGVVVSPPWDRRWRDGLLYKRTAADGWSHGGSTARARARAIEEAG